jgi:AcrR family transcriptional regulator
MRANAQVSELEPRREPQQIRSQRRVEKILEAAAQIFSESGFEAATTNAIAERAEVSIGSVYQFFPNKTALLIQLNLRCIEDMREILNAVFVSGLESLTRDDMIERIIDAFGDFQSRNSALMRVLNTARLPELLSPSQTTMFTEACSHIERLLQTIYPKLTPERRSTVAAVCFTATDALFYLMVNEDARDRVLVEAKILLKAYLGTLENTV